MAQAMTIKARRAPARAVSSFPLWCKGGKHRCGVLRHQAKVSISVQQDQDQQDGRTYVIVEPKTASPPEPFAGEYHFCQIACTSCPLSKWPLLDPFPLNIWEEDQGLYK